MKFSFPSKKLSFLKTSHVKAALIFCLAFAAGTLSAGLLARNSGNVQVSDVSAILSASQNWGLSFQKEGERPIGNATIEELSPYNAYFAQDTEEKVLYLTFDAGYENGNMPKILEALKKHQVSATFFVVGNFLSQNPDLLKQMVAEGHTIGNHTMTHPDMSQISTMENFEKELTGVSDLYKEITGEEMTKFYRPPQGIYNTENLAMAKELGYQTFFWSLAYVDWYQDNQPTKEEAFEKLLKRIHPGAIVLLHSTSSTNAEILDELLTRWEEMGYHFGTLFELISAQSSSGA
jgi:peptidoglycan-N-acetylmuramic acid deacetylase